MVCAGQVDVERPVFIFLLWGFSISRELLSVAVSTSPQGAHREFLNKSLVQSF